MHSMPDAIVLCGGAGLRLRSVTRGAPKSMASVAGRPFLELLLRQLRRNGFDRVILAAGYRNKSISSHFGACALGLQVAYSTEASPLGTVGAARQAAEMVESDDVLIMNGDSYTNADLRKFVADYRESGADVSVVVVPGDGRIDCGAVRVDQNGRVIRFDEKEGCATGRYINSGIYMASRSILDGIPDAVEISLERELFPQWVREGRQIRAFVWPGRCVDIGTPDRYWSAQELLDNVEVEEVMVEQKEL